MLIAIGLVLFVAVAVVGVAGVLDNRGPAHSLTQPFSVLGHHINASSGRLFLYGAVLGAIGLASLLVFLAGVRRTVQRSRRNRRELKEARRATEAIAMDRDQLVAAQHRASPGAAGNDRVGGSSEMPADSTGQHSFFEPTPPTAEAATAPADTTTRRAF